MNIIHIAINKKFFRFIEGVTETSADYDFADSFEYRRANGSQYLYDANGSLIADKSRGIACVTHDNYNNPRRIYFTDGSQTRYKYSATGEKLLVEHYVASPNVMVPFGAEPDALTQGQVMYAGSTQYLLGGSLVMKDGLVDRYLFDGGYAKATFVNPTTYTFEFYYYNQDHLGNNREVVDSAGTVRQVMHYYPFGTPYADPSTILNANMQPYKYNGKELDRMHGLDTYDYGARQYDPVLGRWDRMDPLCEKYYDVSPYGYCGGNPIKYIDPDGREKLIFFQPHVNGNDILIQGAINFKDDGAIHIFAHGSSKGISPYMDLNNKGKEGKTIVHDVSSFMRLLSKSQTWRNRKNGEHVTIVLHGCKTGKGDNSFAEIVSKALKNVTVIAPDNYLYIDEDGEIGVYYSKEDLPEKENFQRDKKKSKERSNKKGSWRVFENGKETQSFKGDWTPKAKSNWLDDLLYRLQAK